MPLNAVFDGRRGGMVRATLLLSLLATFAAGTRGFGGEQTASPSPHPWLGAKDLRSIVSIRWADVVVDAEKLEKAGVPMAAFRPPRRVAEASPVYPETARRAGAQGKVVLECLIRVNGRVDACKIVQGVHPDLDKAAFKALVAWRYEPARFFDTPESVLVAFELTFRLR